MVTAKKLMLYAILIIVLICAGLFIVIDRNKMSIDQNNPINLPSLNSISPDQWQTLASKKVFFAHMSVGNNILEGVQAVLKEHPEIPLHIVETSDPAAMAAPALYHATLGFNSEPTQKIDSFKQLVSAVQPAKPDIATMKLCYVDIYSATDINTIMAHYQQTIDALHAASPDLMLVHCTAPLMSEPLTAKRKCKELIKQLIGRATTSDENYRRMQFNQELKKRFPAKAIFDIAAIESTTPQNFMCYKLLKGEKVPFLYTEYTSDGGHLNREGAKRVAEQLLIFLAQTACGS